MYDVFDDCTGSGGVNDVVESAGNLVLEAPVDAFWPEELVLGEFILQYERLGKITNVSNVSNVVDRHVRTYVRM